MSNFAGLSTGYSALLAHRRRIDVISENIANVNTPGYHRQTAELSSVAAPRAVGFWAGNLDTGGGVQVNGIERAGSSLLERNARDSMSVASQMATEESVMLQIEDAVGGLADQGIRYELDAMWNGFDDLANLPEDLGVRRVTLERVESVARSLRSAAKQLDTLHAGQVETAAVQVSRINELADSVAALDRQIIAAQTTGSSPNSLYDQRDLMISEMAELSEIQVVAEGDGQVSITLDGYLLVGDGRSRPVSFDIQPAPAWDSTGLSVITMVGVDGRSLDPVSGSLGGLFNAANNLIRDDRAALDDIAVDLATQVNDVHSAGVGLDGSSGTDLFVVPTGAVDIRVTDEMSGHPERLAAAAAGEGDLDESNARAMADLADDPDGPSSKVAHFIDSLNVRVSASTSRADAAEGSSAYASSLADSAGGVSLDQELTELIISQRAYEAASRLITTADEMLRTLMTTGLVGR